MKTSSYVICALLLLEATICSGKLNAQTGRVHQQILYVVNESSENISAYKINSSTGALSEIPGSPFPSPGFPVSVAVQPHGRYLFTANYLANTISVFAVNQVSGALTPIVGSPFSTASLPKSITVLPSGRFLYVVSAGTNQVLGYRIASDGALSEIPSSPFATGVDPTSVTVEPLGRFAYVTNANLTFSDDVTGYTVNPSTGALTEISGSPFPAGQIPVASTADASGRFLYVANTLSNNISAYAITPIGALVEISGSPFEAGGNPASLTADPSGRFFYVANVGSSLLIAKRIDRMTGALIPIGKDYVYSADAVITDGTGGFAYVQSQTAHKTFEYRIDPATGTLSPIAGSPFLGKEHFVPVGMAVAEIREPKE